MKAYFKNFIKELCVREELVDIASEAIMTQSSLSQWSRSEDSRKLFDDHSNDFGFHTENEVDPWVLIDLGHESIISYLVIENRRNRNFQHLAAKLKVEAIADSGDYLEVYNGIANFGAFPDQLPLIIPVLQAYSARKIKITRIGSGYFHLSRIHVLCKRTDIARRALMAKTIILNSRTDGLGQRIWSMINGMVIAGMDDGFHFLSKWPDREGSLKEFHAILPEVEMFSREFLAEHGARDFNIRPDCQLNSPEFVKALDPISEMRRRKVVLSFPEDLLSYLPNLKGKIPVGAFGRAYDKIEFSENIEVARLAARQVPLHEKSVAVHLRAGDIVYGRFRLVDRFIGKVAPFPLVDALLSRLATEGNSIIVFGQDEGLCQYFSEKYGAIRASDVVLERNFDEYQAAVFEITLMSRCSTIYAGSSGFSQIASVIGSSNILDFRGIFDKREVVDLILRGFANGDPRVSDLQKAFALRYACVIGAECLTDDRKAEIMEQALDFDPGNGFYQFVQISLRAARGDYNALNDQVRILNVNRERESVFSAVVHKHPDGRMDAERYISPILHAAVSGCAGAAAIAALFFSSRGGRSLLSDMIKICAGTDFENHPFVQFSGRSLEGA